LVGSIGLGGAYHPCSITAAEASRMIAKKPMAIGSRHQGIAGRVVGFVADIKCSLAPRAWAIHHSPALNQAISVSCEELWMRLVS
jgi:hypothetical protein